MLSDVNIILPTKSKLCLFFPSLTNVIFVQSIILGLESACGKNTFMEEERSRAEAG